MKHKPIDPLTGSVLVGPGASAVYGVDIAGAVELNFDRSRTAGRYATDAFAKALEKVGTPRGDNALASVVECGSAAGELWSSSTAQVPLTEMLPGIAETNGNCWSAVKTLKDLRSGPQTFSVADELRDAAKGVGSSFWDDAAKYGSRAVALLAKAPF